MGQHVNVSNMISLQRVRGLWRIYLDNQEDRELLLSSTLVLRNKSVNFYTRNPRYAFKEKTDTTKVRVKDIPLSADDGQITKALEDHNWDIVKFFASTTTSRTVKQETELLYVIPLTHLYPARL